MAQNELIVRDHEELKSDLKQMETAINNLIETMEKSLHCVNSLHDDSASMLKFDEQVTKLWTPVCQSLKEFREGTLPALKRAAVDAEQATTAQNLDLGRAFGND